MTSELKPCPKCLSDRVTCWNVTGGNQIVCKDCGLRNKPDVDETAARNDWNTRAVPAVPELVRYQPIAVTWDDGSPKTTEMVLIKDGEYVRYDQAAAVITAKDEIIEKQECIVEKLERKLRHWIERAEAAEAVITDERQAAIDARNLLQYEKDQQWKERAEAAEAKLAEWEKADRLVAKALWEDKVKVLEAKLAQIEEPIGYVSKSFFESLKIDRFHSIAAYVLRESSERYSEPLYAGPVASDADLRAENERLRGALEFYADQDKWESVGFIPSVSDDGGHNVLTLHMPDAVNDHGNIARAALTPSEPRI